MITIEQAKRLKPGDCVYHAVIKDSTNSPERWRVTGKPKIWKRSPDKVKVPVKHGLYDYGYITEENIHLVIL